jgi:hypothetical protein
MNDSEKICCDELPQKRIRNIPTEELIKTLFEIKASTLLSNIMVYHFVRRFDVLRSDLVSSPFGGGEGDKGRL